MVHHTHNQTCSPWDFCPLVKLETLTKDILSPFFASWTVIAETGFGHIHKYFFIWTYWN